MRNIALNAILAVGVAACQVGPQYTQPDQETASEWHVDVRDDFRFEPPDSIEWWQIFNDPVLSNLIKLAHVQNNNIKVAGLRVIEARAALGIATGSRYPQSQFAAGDLTSIRVSEDDGAGGGDVEYTRANLGVNVVWEADFWGRFSRGIDAADANLLASTTSFDDALILLNAQVADTYVAIRTNQVKLRLAKENLALQQRSHDIVDVLFRYGASNELDVQQAETLLLSTEATIPGIEIELQQAKNAMATLLGMPPGVTDPLIAGEEIIPVIPATLQIGVPADMLRQRPDVRRAEFVAMAETAQVGIATTNLYPTFTLAGTIGFAATGNNDAVADSESITYAFGPQFVWPFFNYGRLENNIRVEDAQLQQALINYRETVIRAAREVEDSIVTFEGTQRQDDILQRGVESAIRSSDLSMLRYREGFADYQRVLDAQQSLFGQQQRYIGNKGLAVRSVIGMYLALGGGWQNNVSFIDDATKQQMIERVNWGDYLETDRQSVQEIEGQTEQ